MGLKQIIINHLMDDIKESAIRQSDRKCDVDAGLDCMKEAVSVAVDVLEDHDMDDILARAKHLKNIDLEQLSSKDTLDETKEHLMSLFEDAVYASANQNGTDEMMGWNQCLYFVLHQLSDEQRSKVKQVMRCKEWFED